MFRVDFAFVSRGTEAASDEHEMQRPNLAQDDETANIAELA